MILHHLSPGRISFCHLPNHELPSCRLDFAPALELIFSRFKPRLLICARDCFVAALLAKTEKRFFTSFRMTEGKCHSEPYLRRIFLLTFDWQDPSICSGYWHIRDCFVDALLAKSKKRSTISFRVDCHTWDCFVALLLAKTNKNSFSFSRGDCLHEIASWLFSYSVRKQSQRRIKDPSLRSGWQ